MTISIQGERGSFHDQVTSIIFDVYDLTGRESFQQVFDDVASGTSEFGFVAIENSIAGAILENYDLLKDFSDKVEIAGEYKLPVSHNLISLPDTKKEQIEYIWSHPMAIKQSKEFLSKNFPNASILNHADTAGAVREILERKLTNYAAIASSKAAEVYNMKIQSAAIETDKQNFTRFLLLKGKKLISQVNLQTESNMLKTSIFLNSPHKSGALYDALGVFQSLKLSLTMLVSRPIVGSPFEYGFYIDFLSSDYKQVELLIEVLSMHANDLISLGTYKQHL